MNWKKINKIQPNDQQKVSVYIDGWFYEGVFNKIEKSFKLDNGKTVLLNSIDNVFWTEVILSQV